MEHEEQAKRKAMTARNRRIERSSLPFVALRSRKPTSTSQPNNLLFFCAIVAPHNDVLYKIGIDVMSEFGDHSLGLSFCFLKMIIKSRCSDG